MKYYKKSIKSGFSNKKILYSEKGNGDSGKEKLTATPKGFSGSLGFFSPKGQVSLEFMTYIILLTLMLAIVSFAAVTRNISTINEKINMDARRTAKLIATEINTAVSIGDGYYHAFSLPLYLYGGKEYDITISADYGRVYVDWEDMSYSAAIITSNVTGAAVKGTNLIRNDRGVIKIE